MLVTVFCMREEGVFEKRRLDSDSKPNSHPLDRQSYIVVRVQCQFSFSPCWFLLYMCMFLLPVEFSQQSTFSCFHFYLENPGRDSQTYQISSFSYSASQFRYRLLHLWKECVLQKISANNWHRFIDISKCNQFVINKQNDIPYRSVGSNFLMFLKTTEPGMETDISLSLEF